MKKKIFACLLSFLLLFSCMAPYLETVAYTEKENATATSKQKNENTEKVQSGKASEGSKEEDKIILTEDVPFETVEWTGEETQNKKKRSAEPVRENEIVLVLDVSGSMSGDAMTEMKKACSNFVDDILNEDANAGIAIVTFESSVRTYTYGGSFFTNDRNDLKSTINSLGVGGSTAMNAGLRRADEILQQYGTAGNKIIIQMADGLPNSGQPYTTTDARYYGSTFTDPDGETFTYSNSTKGYASEIYNTFRSISGLYRIYSLGFFHSMSGTEKQFAATFLNDIQNQGYFEVENADNLSFSFEEIAENINRGYLVLNKSSLSVATGDREQLTVSFSSDYPSTDKFITWSSSNPDIASVRSDGLVTGVAMGSCTITAEAGGYRVSCPVTVGAVQLKYLPQSVYVYQNENGQEAKEDKYVAAENAVVTYDGEEYMTGDVGLASLPEVETEITVSKEGYSTRVITAAQLKESNNIYLQKTSENPVINAVWVGTTDLLSSEYLIPVTESSSTTFAADIDWGDGGAGSIKLVQGTREESFSGNGLSMVLKNKFDVSESLYILATNAKGYSTKRELKIEVDSTVPGLEGASFSIGNSIALSLPDSFPLIGGKNVNLKMDTSTGTLPIQAVVDNGKVYVTIGVDVVKYSQTKNSASSNVSGKKAKHEKEETKYLLDNIKDAFDMKDAKKGLNKVKNIKQTYKTAMKYPQGSFGFDADFTVLGFLEGTIDGNNKIVFLDSGLILNPSVSADWSGQFSIGPVPCYWEAAIKAAVEAKMNLYRNNEEAQFLPSGSIGGTVTGSVGAGAGINKVLSIGGGGDLTFKPTAQFYSDDTDTYFSLVTSIGLYFKAVVVGFEYKFDPDPIGEWKIDNSTKARSKLARLLPEKEIYDEDNYKMMDLSYLEESNSFMKEAPSVMAAGDGFTEHAVEELLFHENSYGYTVPKVVSLEENTKLAVWLDGQTADVNRIQVYYSYFDGADWTEPEVIEADGTMDSMPEIYAAGNTAYVVWQDASKQVGDADTLDTMAQKMGITAAVFSGVDQEFTVTSITEGGSLDMLPVVTAEGGTVAVAWVRNTDGNWFGEGTNQICTAYFRNGAWEQSEVYRDNLQTVTSLDADFDHGTLNVAYAMKAEKLSAGTENRDESTETADMTEIYVNHTRITDNTVVDAAPVFSDHALYWISGGTLYCSETLNGEDTAAVLSENVTLPTDNYRFVEDGRNKAILYAASEGLYSDVYGIFYDNGSGEWGEPIRLTNSNASITAFDAVWQDDTLQMLCNKTAVTGEISMTEKTGNPYGQTNLVWMTWQKRYGLSIEDCVYDPADIISESTLPITITLENTGSEYINGVTVAVQDEHGEEVSTVDISLSLAAGKQGEISFDYLVPGDAIGKQYTVVCEPQGREESSTSCTLDFQYEDLALKNLNWSHKNEETVIISGMAANEGYNRQEKVLINLYKDSMTTQMENGEQKGEVLRSIYIEDGINSMDAQEFAFEVPYEKNAVYYVEIEPREEEYNTTNNSDYVYFFEEEKTPGRTLQSLQASIEKTDYQTGETLDIGGLSVVAEYSDGTKAEVKSFSNIDLSKVDMNKEGTYVIPIEYEDQTVSVEISVYSGQQVNPGVKPSNPQEGSSEEGDNRPSVIPGGQNTGGNHDAGTNTGSSGGQNTLPDEGPSQQQQQGIVPLPIGTQINVQGGSYRVIRVDNVSPEVEYRQPLNKKAAIVTIPSKVVVNGITYKVTTIGSRAFAGCMSLRTVKIGASVKNIKANAFNGCRKLRKIIITSRKLKKIGKKAFKNIYARAYFKTPKVKKKKYMKLLKKKTIGYKITWKLK